MSTTSKPFTFLSYGGGVQTRAAVQLIKRGDLPKPDAILFGDTQCEPQAVYEGVQQDKCIARSLGIPMLVRSWGNLFTPPYGIHTPLYTLRPDGKKGQLFRTCTDRFKIRPIRQYLRGIGVKFASALLGITRDEIERAKPSQLKWYEHKYPILDLTRSDCTTVLNEEGIAPVKSACTFCPYRGREMWQSLHGKDLQQAVDYDEKIRNARPGFESFVHSSRKPLREALDLPTVIDEGCHSSEGCFL